MIILLSPAKSLNFDNSKFDATSSPKFRKEALELIEILRKYDKPGIQKLMGVSENIAQLNVGRYASYKSRFTDKNSKAAVVAFDGDVYKGMNAESFDTKDMEFAQDHLRILSGLYGLLRPLDKIQAYRLEMGTDLQNPNGKNLYQFWGDKVSDQIKRDLKGKEPKMIVNLASNEYAKVVNFKKLALQTITPNFKEFRGDELKFISFNAKKARGMMARFIIKNRITTLEEIKSFDTEGYRYSPDHSKGDQLIFVR